MPGVGGRGKSDPPFELLVGQYIRAVMDGRPPAAVCRYKFKLSRSQWEDRRSVLGKSGWLPAGDPVRDGAVAGRYDQAWLDRALELYGAKLEALEAKRSAKAAAEHARAEQAALRAGHAAAWARAKAARQRRLAQAAVAQQASLVFDIIG